MKHEFSARQLHISAFAQSQGTLEGEEGLVHFERLAQESQGPVGDTPVVYAARGEMRPDAAGEVEPWLHLSAQTRLQLVCQRCLGLADLAVGFERSFRFVASEALAEVEDEESEEDVLAWSTSFDLLALVEDELLMAAPLIPMHDTCPEPVKMQAVDGSFEQPAEPKAHPFAVLQSLKKPASD